MSHPRPPTYERCSRLRRSRTYLVACAILLGFSNLAAFTLAIPNFRPPPELEAYLPQDWKRGLPPIWEESHLYPRRKYNHKHDHPGPSPLHQCLRQAGAHWDLTSPFVNGSAVYWDAAQSDNLRFHYHPDAIIYPRSQEDIASAIHCARQHGNVPVTARSGGHSFAGLGSGGEDGHLIVDMENFDHVRVHPGGKTADIGPGALLGDVIKGLWGRNGEYKVGIPHGTCPVVGTGGHALCGGFGPTSRKWGLTTDTFIEATMVLANSSIVTLRKDSADTTSPPAQLLKALKGTGAQFGIVTNFKFETFDVSGPFTFIEYRWSPSITSGADMARILSAIQAFATEPKSHLPPELGFHVQLLRATAEDPPGGNIAMHLRGVYMGPKAYMKHNVMSHLFMRHIPKHGAPQPDSIREDEMNYLDLMAEWDDFGQPGHKLDTAIEKVRRNNFLARTQLTLGQRGFSDESMKKMMNFFFDENRRQGYDMNGTELLPSELTWSWNVYMEMYGGPSPRHASLDLVKHSSFPHRDALWLIQSSIGTWGHQALTHAAHKWLSQSESKWKSSMAKDGIQRASFPCYTDATLRKDDEWKTLYHNAEILQELELVKKAVDPWNTFRSPMSIWSTEDRIPPLEKKKQEDILKEKAKKAKAKAAQLAKLKGGKSKHHGATIKTTDTHTAGIKILHPLP